MDYNLLRQILKRVGQLKSLEAKQQTALHLVCKVGPPFGIVKRIIEIRYTWTVSASYSPGAWNYLLVGSWNHYWQPYDKGMTPLMLMLACRDMIHNDENMAICYPWSMLMAICPSVIHVEDENKMNAMEFARLSGCSLLMMIHLSRITEGMGLSDKKVWRGLTQKKSSK